MEKKLNLVKVGLVSLSTLIVILFALDAVSIEFLITFSLGLLALIVLATVGAAVLNFSENPKTGKSFLIGIVALLIVFGVSYGISTDAIDVDSNQVIAGSKAAEAGIYTLYVLVFIAIASLLYSSVKRIFS